MPERTGRAAFPIRAIRSIRGRATLLISGLVVAVIVAYAAAAYHEMKAAAAVTARARLTGASGELASMLTVSAEQVKAGVSRVAGDPRIAAYLRAPSASARRAAVAALGPGAGGDGIIGTELRDAAGRRVLLQGEAPSDPRLDPLEADLARALREPKPARVTPFGALGDTVLYAVAAPVSDGGDLGRVVQWRRLAAAEEARATIEDLIGPDIRFYVANRRGDVWTDLGNRVPAPEIGRDGLEGVATYARPGVGRVLAAATPVPGSPWAVVVELPYEAVAAGPKASTVALLGFGVLLLIAAAYLAWLLSGRLTGSIAELADAAGSISAGDYSRRVSVAGADELAILSAAFNTMAERVADARDQLEEKVAELAASESRNRESRERMEHVITSSRAILYQRRLPDSGGTLTWVSDNVRQVLGHEPAEVLTPGWWRSRLHPDDLGRFAQASDQLRETGDSTQEYRFLRADGEYRWVQDSQHLLPGGSGGEAGEVVGLLTDVTEHRHLEFARDAAEAANQAKNAFLSRMSHELRTPMNAILGFAQLLETETETEENRESVQQILRGGRHLLSLIDEVLDIARIEAGQVSLSVEPVSARRVVEESVDLVRHLATAHGIRIHVDETLTRAGHVAADQQRLKQVLLNLLSNAIKYNRRNGSVTVSCEPLDGDRVRITVADTGFGIPAAKRDRLFTPFDRLGAEQSGVEGTGLGLALSKGLVEAMGGRLGVDSVDGEGSRFWLDLPTESPPDLPEPAAAGGEHEVRARTTDPTHTVLFVEDNLANVRLMERVLHRRPQLNLLTAMQGRVGLELARDQRPDLILLDLNLPDLTGEGVLRALKQDPALRHIPVIMISGDAIRTKVQRMLDLGAHAYITKPFDIQELLRLIDDRLDLHHPD